MRSRRREGLGFPQDLVTIVVGHHDERRDLDVHGVAADGLAVPTEHLDFVSDRLRIADEVARFGGSWTFIITFLALLVVYAGVNIGLRRAAWDPYPFILLNLFLSMLAAIQAPVIMMSQNRQDTKDRLRGELDYDVNRRAESGIQGLARKLNLLGEKIGDVEDLLRRKA